MVDYVKFKSAFEGDIVEASSPDYSASISRWAAQSVRKARYVAFVKEEADVVLALKFAISNSIPLAIKCGGHNPSGASSVEDGLVIDLSRYFNTIRVDADKKLAYVGGGALWETVDLAAAKHGLATPGGTVSHTGVAGLTLAGGYGWLTGEHGMVIDNLVQATVVTADGSIVVASETSHPDLFWGIRGGGSNFGVVTEFVLKLHPQRKTVFLANLAFPPSLLPKLAELIDDWHSEVIPKEALVFTFARGPPPERMPVVGIIAFYNGSEEEGRARFKQFYDLGPAADTSRELPYEELNAINNVFAAHGRNWYMGGSSLRSKLSLQVQKVFDRFVALTDAHPDHASNLPPFETMVGYELFSLDKVNAVAPDAMAFRSRGPQSNVVIMIAWDKEEEGKPGTSHARRIHQEIASLIESTAERPPKENENEVYTSYVSELTDVQAKMRGLWGENYPKLQKVKKQYDPNLVFDRWFPIQPAN